jgi:hypothetical protein
LLQEIDLNALFDDLDNRLFGPDHLDDALDLLFRERLTDLNPPVRARMIHAVQSGATWSTHEGLIRDTFLAHHGEELTRFKNLVNAASSHYDLEKLLWDDIDNEGIRKAILDHFAAEATDLPQHEVKLLSDIDDTVVCRLHDDRYPRGTIYPGVLALYDEIDAGPGHDRQESGDLTFITARPGDALGLIERYTRTSLHKHGYPSYSVMSGTLLALRSKEAMAARKLVNFGHYRQLFPEYGFVFVGDSGQGDVLVGRQMLTSAPQAMRGVFIHDVVHTKAQWQAKGIFAFDTYAGAAAEAFRRGLISRAGLSRVAESVTTGMSEIAFDSDEQKQARMAELEEDLAAVERALGAEVMP